MGLATWDQRVLIFSIACHGVMLWRLWSQKLAAIYRFLTMFLAAEMLQNIVLFPFRPNSNVYARIFFISSPVVWALAYGVVIELCSVILEDYPGIASVGRRAVSGCMGIAVVISTLYAIPDLKTSGGPFPYLHIYLVLERSIILGLLVFLLLIQLFLFRYRLELPRNRKIYATGYAIYFGMGEAEDVILTALGVRIAPIAGLLIVTASGLLLLAGAALLSRSGEARVRAVSLEAEGERERLRRQLDEINGVLTRTVRSGRL